MNNMQKSFKRKSALRCMAEGGAVGNSVQEQRRQNPQFYEPRPQGQNAIPLTTPKQINSPVQPLTPPTAPAGIALKDPAMLAASVQSRLANMSKPAPYDRTGGIMPSPAKLSVAPPPPPDRGTGRMRAVGLRAGLRMVAPRLVPGAGLATLGKQLYDETRPGGMLARGEGTVKFRPLPIQDASEGAKPARNARRMADGGAVYKSTQRIGQDDIQSFSDAPGTGAPYTPTGPTAPPTPTANEIGPPTALATMPEPAKLSIKPQAPVVPGAPAAPAAAPVQYKPQDPYAKMTGKPPVAIGAPPVSAGMGLRSAGSAPRMGTFGSVRSEIGANRAEIGANRTPIGAPRMGALGRPIMTSVGYASGGKVRGPGGPTEDKIPAMLSDGEYVLPADTVKKVGVQNLDALKDATHTRGKSSLRNGVMHLAGGSTRNYMPLPEQNQTAPAVWPPRDSLGLVTPPARLDNVVQKPVAPLDQRLPKIADTYPNGSPVGVSAKSVPAAQLPTQAEAAKMVAQQTGYNPTLAMVETGTPSQQPMPPRLSSEVLSGMTNVGVMRGIGKPQTPLTDEQQRKRIADGIESAAPIMGSALRQNLESLDSSTGPLELGLRIARGTGQTLLAGGEAALRAAGGALQGDGPSLSEQWHRGLGTTPAPAPTPVPTPAPGAPAPGGTPALPEGVTQRPDGIYQQGNSFTNIVGADGKPQLLQEERMGPPSPAAEAYLARTPEMQFGPIPSGPGSSLRGGRGGSMRLNMPNASSGINARFDKMVSDYTKNANWSLSPSKTARTLADIEQARTNALNGVMGNDTTRRGQDMAASSAAARDAAGLAQEGMRGQFGLLAGEAAASAAAQKAQDAKEMAYSKEDRANFDQMYGDKPEKNEAFETYAANRHLLPDGVEGVQQAGAMLGMLKAAGLAPGTRIEAFGANPVTGGAGSEESDLGTRYDAAGGGLRGLGASLNPADLFGDDNYYTIHTKAGPKKVARRALKGGDSQMQTWQELLGRNNLE